MIRGHRSIVNKNWWKWNHSKTLALIFVPSAFLFYTLFNMAFHNRPSSSDSVISNEVRSRLYDKMERDLDENGPAFLKKGETSQSLSLSDIFTLKDGYVTPILKAANPPVRANVLYLSTEYSVRISNAVYQQLSFCQQPCDCNGQSLVILCGLLTEREAVKHIFNPYFDKAIWFQNSSMYHFSMFHASHHITPVPATEDEIEVEASAVHAVADDLCPLKIVLDRVVLTSTGVLLGCWQVISGTDPITIRAKLRTALPHAPEKQLYDAAILHTSFARLLGHPTATPMELHKTSDEVQFFHDLVAKLNNQIRGMEAVVSELWYVEEYDVLALALDGRTKIRRFQLGCSRTQDSKADKHN